MTALFPAVAVAAALAATPAAASGVRLAFPDALRVWATSTPDVPVEWTDPGAGRVEVRLADANGASAFERTVSVAGPGIRRIRVGPVAPGWYELTVTPVAGEARGKPAGTSIAVLPESEAPLPVGSALESPFGVCTHFGRSHYDRPETYELLKRSGIRWIRDDLSWDSVERVAPGTHAIPVGMRQTCARLAGDGIRSLLILGYASPFHPHATAEEPPAFEAYAEFVARELAGTVDHFEIWNEPNGFGKLTPELYPAILKAGYRGVKRGNPDAFIVGIGGSAPGGWGGHYIHGGIYPQNAAAFMDSFSIHPYTSPWAPETGYASPGAPAPLACLETAEALTFGLARRIAAEKGEVEPPGIWITEIGWPTTEVSPAAQARCAARAYLLAAARPDLFARIFLYDLICDGDDPKNKEHTFGLLNHDLSPRPAYVAAATVVRELAGRRFLRRLAHPDETVRLYLFGPEADPLLAAWMTEIGPAAKRADPSLGRADSREDARLRVRLAGVGQAVSVIDWQGRSSTATLDAGRVDVELSTRPQYLRGVEIGVTAE